MNQNAKDMALGRECRMEGIRSAYTLGKVLGMLEMYSHQDKDHKADPFLQELADASVAEQESADD